MGGRYSRNKGARFERALVHMMQDHKFAAERVPLSGAMQGSWSGDISFPFGGIDRRIEVKKRATGFKQIYQWLANHFALIIGADRSEPLIVLPFKRFLEIAALAELGRAYKNETTR